jgi:YD repeat-containing protein
VTLTVSDNLGAQSSVQTTANISTSSSDQFAQTFLYWGLGRTPNGDENGYWSDIMRAAYPQGQTSMLMAMKEFGMTVFESQEYAQRGRTNHDYVYDLYKTYMMRDPDQDGWNFWTGVCDTYGRQAVRQAFDESGEFHDIVASLAASGNPSSAVGSLATAQVDPFNQSGNQIKARDCEWTMPLISLPGRAGLDLGLNLSYSSLVWTRSGPYAYFDQDYESLSPGFTIGFPTVQWRKFDAQTGHNVYIFAAGGHHVELRQVGSTNIYEAADSSYLQLVDYGGSLSLRTTEGTELSFSPLLYGWSVTQIKDRNGNFITVENDWRGDIQHITDTLSRIINFIYDNNANLIRIEQAWTGQSQPHVWASFGWGGAQMSPTFGEVVGTHAGENVLVLNFVGFDDGSYTRFNYNGYAQVREIKHFGSDSNPASDNHLLNTTVYNYGASDDPTRLTETQVSAENWTGVNDVPSQVINQFSASGDTHQMTAPDGTTYKEFYGGTGSSPVWQHGLVVATQVVTGSTVQKSTATSWTQDDADALYQTNPRVYQTDVSDGTNHRKTTIGYQTFTLPTTNASCSLPNEIYEYAADQTNVLRRTHTDYVLAGSYINDYRRIVGLPSTKLLYEGFSTLKSKTTYIYDQSEFMQNTPAPAIQHDDYNYSTGFVVGRANATKIIRWNVDDPNQTAETENKIGYDITGNVVFTRDALNRQTNISYADGFSVDGTSLDAPRSFATLAYPTTITDADGFSSTLWYRYDFGGKTRAQGPPPQNQTNGIIQTTSYDDATRVRRITSGNTRGYTHYVYGSNYTQSYSSVNTVALNYWDSDAYSIQVFDGVGHVIYSGGNHPGSIGGYRTVSSIYDKMGRLAAQSNPTEITGAGVPAGDDDPSNPNGQGHGFVYTHYTYDWKGRPLLTINPSTTVNPNDVTYKEASYEGCGCAGGGVMTLTDEGTVVNGQNVARRQKIYSDVLGRQWKTEVLNWDGSVYSSRVLAYNVRDQITSAKQYQGPESSGIYQEETQTHDGYGRLATRKSPVETTPTTYIYYENDKPQTVTDARGITTSYSYNNRGLVTDVSSSSSSTVAMHFGYDAASNRTLMTDDSGTVTYQYDSLSRLTSETKQFSNGPSGSYTLTYEYNLTDALKAITDPVGSRVDYGFDSAGRLTNITGSGANSAPTYAANFAYRAWGAIKDFDFGNAVHQHLNFNTRLQTTSFGLSNLYAGGVMNWSYDYYSDGKLQRVTDSAAPNFDRYFDYDHEGRTLNALTGSEARGGTTADGPFKQTYGYDVWENTTSRSYRVWTQNPQSEGPINYPNNRHANWQYDGAGNITSTYDANFGYDAAGRNNYYSANVYLPNGQPALEIAQTFDGDSTPVSKTETSRSDPNAPASVTTTYYLRSSALGGKVVAELDNTGYKRVGHIFAGGMEIATQRIWNPGYGSEVTWVGSNPATGSSYMSDTGRYVARQEFDPLGTDVTNPPDTNLLTVDQPVFDNPKFDHMPLEYEGGPSEDAQIPDWYLHMAYAQWDMHLAQGYWQSGHRDLAAEIVANNPNVGVQYNIVGFGLQKPLTGTVFGQAAADFLNGLSQAIGYGDLVEGTYRQPTIARSSTTSDRPTTASINVVGADPVSAAPGDSASEADDYMTSGPFVFPDIYDNFENYEGRAKTKWCATWVQQVAEKLGRPLGRTSNWYAGAQVGPNTAHGTAIMSGVDKNGHYPGNDTGNHAGFFLWWMTKEGYGFAILENVNHDVRIRYVTGRNGYYSGADQYYEIMVRARVTGGMSGGRRP